MLNCSILITKGKIGRTRQWLQLKLQVNHRHNGLGPLSLKLLELFLKIKQKQIPGSALLAFLCILIGITKSSLLSNSLSTKHMSSLSTLNELITNSVHYNCDHDSHRSCNLLIRQQNPGIVDLFPDITKTFE